MLTRVYKTHPFNPRGNKMARNRKNRVKQGQLECHLQQLDTLESQGFQRHAWSLEQYPIPPSVASECLSRLQLEHSAFEGKRVADFGCGSGILAIGCVLLGAVQVIAVDIDEDSVRLTQQNAINKGIDDKILTCICMDIKDVTISDIPVQLDTIIMNPPFGTKNNEGIDRLFVEKSLELASTVYSFHKTSTRDYWLGTVAKELNCKVEPLFQVQFPIDRLFRFHRQDRKNIVVDILKFERET